MTNPRLLLPSVALAAVLALAGCGHKQVPLPAAPEAPPAAAAPAPTVTLAADPTAVERGAASTLTWTSSHAVRVELNGTAVNLNGSQPETPTQSTDYQMVAHSADGRTANAAVRITVTEPPAPPPVAPPAEAPIDANAAFTENVRDAFFDYDKSDIRPDAEGTLQAAAQYLKAHPEISVMIEGHCDDRGSAEYNLALGDRRATAVKNYLVQQGADASRIQTVSDGKEKPFCTEQTEDCYQQNRRGHLVKQ